MGGGYRKHNKTWGGIGIVYLKPIGLQLCQHDIGLNKTQGIFASHHWSYFSYCLHNIIQHFVLIQ